MVVTPAHQMSKLWTVVKTLAVKPGKTIKGALAASGGAAVVGTAAAKAAQALTSVLANALSKYLATDSWTEDVTKIAQCVATYADYAKGGTCIATAINIAKYLTTP